MKAVLLASAALLFVVPAAAGDWTIAPWTHAFQRYTVTVGGTAHGTLFSPDLPSVPGFDQQWASGLTDASLRVQRYYDNGLMMSLHASFEVAHDKLSMDNYGGDLVQKVYGVMQTGLGRVEVGMTDGAAYVLSVTGPVVDEATSMDNADVGFFLDPSTGRDFTEVFALNSAVDSSLNYAKFSYYTPRLFGLQLAVSYTPSEGKEVIPFLNNGPNVPNRQKSIWEWAVSYSNTFGRTSVGAYFGGAVGHGDRKTPGHAGLTDWGMGTEIDYDLNDDMRFAIGGAWRQSNAYTFDIYDVLSENKTTSVHLSSTLTYGSWIFGGEIGSGSAEGGVLAPTMGVHGYQASVGYVINKNWQATFGWQQLRYSRDTGVFYNGDPRIHMDAVFFHLGLHV